MFGLFSANATKKLDKQYHALLKQAMDAQRAGDIRRYSELSVQADAVLKELEQVRSAGNEK